jgi:hypothetical protein
MMFGSMGRIWVWALHVITVDVQREVAGQHGSNNIWPHVDPM